MPTRIASLQQAIHAAVVQFLEQAVIGQSLSGTIIGWNLGAEKLFGYSAGEIVGQSVAILLSEADRVRDQAAFDRVMGGEQIEPFELDCITKSHEHAAVSMSIWPIYDKHSRIVGGYRVAKQVGNEIAGELANSVSDATLADISQFRTLGQIAQGIAHELNQPLNAILAYAEGSLGFMESVENPSRRIRSGLELIVQEASRAGEIIRSLRAVARDREPQRMQLAVNKLIGETKALLEYAFNRSNVKVQLELADDLPLVWGNRVQIVQVLVNLVQNAVQSMRADGAHGDTLTIRSSKEGNGVRIDVIDEGCGIPLHVAQSLFSGNISTKPDGLGMGLAICRAIIERGGGELSYKPNPAGGTMMSFTLQGTENGEKHECLSIGRRCGDVRGDGVRVPVEGADAAALRVA